MRLRSDRQRRIRKSEIEISRLSKHAQQHWDESEPRRREIVEGARSRKMEGDEPYRAELAVNAKIMRQATQKAQFKIKGRVGDLAARRPKKSRLKRKARGFNFR